MLSDRVVRRVQCSPGFVGVLLAMLLLDTERVLPLFLTAALLHECGHLLLLYATGGALEQIRLQLGGAVLCCHLPTDGCAQAAIALAGPLANLLAALLAMQLQFSAFAGANLLLGFFNLLPLPPLDGGCALAALCRGHLPRLRTAVSVGTAVLLLAGGVLLFMLGGGIWLLLTGGAVLCAAGKAACTMKGNGVQCE